MGLVSAVSASSRSPDIAIARTLIVEDGRTDGCPRVLTDERG
jgi:hypothetical protein